MFREATEEDLVALRDLERAANLVALGHIFPADRYPFPDDDVLARWALVLAEPGVTVLVYDDEPGAGLLAFVAYDETTLRHLAVRPDRWGTGIATAAIETVVRAMRARDADEVSLWCLADNQRARRLYERHGWRLTADRQEAMWPPHPIELRYTRALTVRA
jgi:RimJ/RimL family protein N-acetyltransferase